MRRQRRRGLLALGGCGRRTAYESDRETDDEKMLKRTQAWDTFDTASTAGLSVIEEEQSSHEDVGVAVTKTAARDDTPSTVRNCSSLLDDDEEEDEESVANSVDSSPKMQRKLVDFDDTPSSRSRDNHQKNSRHEESSASSPPRIIRTHRSQPCMIGIAASTQCINVSTVDMPQHRETALRTGTETASQVVEPLSCREKIEQVRQHTDKSCLWPSMTHTHPPPHIYITASTRMRPRTSFSYVG